MRKNRCLSDALLLALVVGTLGGGAGCSSDAVKFRKNAGVGGGVTLTGVVYEPHEGAGGSSSGGGTITIGGVDYGPSGRPIRVIVTNDPNGNGVVDPGEDIWVGATTPPPTKGGPTGNPIHPITDEIELGPGDTTIVVIVHVQNPDGTITTIRTEVDGKPKRRGN